MYMNCIICSIIICKVTLSDCDGEELTERILLLSLKVEVLYLYLHLHLQS